MFTTIFPDPRQIVDSLIRPATLIIRRKTNASEILYSSNNSFIMLCGLECFCRNLQKSAKINRRSLAVCRKCLVSSCSFTSDAIKNLVRTNFRDAQGESPITLTIFFLIRAETVLIRIYVEEGENFLLTWLPIILFGSDTLSFCAGSKYICLH